MKRWKKLRNRVQDALNVSTTDSTNERSAIDLLDDIKTLAKPSAASMPIIDELRSRLANVGAALEKGA